MRGPRRSASCLSQTRGAESAAIFFGIFLSPGPGRRSRLSSAAQLGAAAEHARERASRSPPSLRAARSGLSRRHVKFLQVQTSSTGQSWVSSTGQSCLISCENFHKSSSTGQSSLRPTALRAVASWDKLGRRLGDLTRIFTSVRFSSTGQS